MMSGTDFFITEGIQDKYACTATIHTTLVQKKNDFLFINYGEKITNCIPWTCYKALENFIINIFRIIQKIHNAKIQIKNEKM